MRMLSGALNGGFAGTAINRRRLLAGAGAAFLCGVPQPGAARAAASGQQAPGIYRYKIGNYELTACYDGIWNRPIDDKFVKNAYFPDVQQAMADAYLPIHVLPTPFTPLTVNTGGKLILIDTGSGGQIAPTAGSLVANLAAAGIAAKAIDIILISNFHPDHINGIKTKDDERVFPNAEILVPTPEWAFWMDDGKMSRAKEPVKSWFLNARRIFEDIANDVRRFQPGTEVAPGITSVPAYGHTPGHCAYIVADGDQSLFVLCDTTNVPALFARHPEWQAIIDQDGALAVETRRRILDQAVAGRMQVQGYHFPFPGHGHIAKRGSGYEFVPAMWQSTL
jgi:glyoxylase-like metal-dependent hydrolase (beta-lactamase superfamily II)